MSDLSSASPKIRIVGVGGYLPEKVMTNHDFPAELETSDEWIATRTGIHARHLAAPTEGAADLGVAALDAALRGAGVSAESLEALVVATTTPDKTFPATAVSIQQRIGMTGGFAFDLQAVCSGFLYALAVARGLMLSQNLQRVAVVGVDVMSRILDWNDRATCVLFGDGAGAVILERAPADAPGGLIDFLLASDGCGAAALHTTGGPASTQTAGVIHMNGREVYRAAITHMGEAIEMLLARHNLTVDDVDWIVPHQANARIVEAVMKRLNFPLKKVILRVDEHANTSAASIPLALWRGVARGQIKPGERLILVTMGAGFTWGSALLEWSN